jgi:hypothetical protein
VHENPEPPDLSGANNDEVTMSNDKREPKPETKLPFFALPTDKPMTTRSGIRAGAKEEARKRSGG